MGRALDGQKQCCQRQSGGQGLNEQDAAAGGCGPKEARHQHASQKEQCRGATIPGYACDQRPDQPRCQKAVVQALIGGQSLGAFGKFDRKPKGAAPARAGSEQHFQRHDIEMQHSDQRDQGGGNHGGILSKGAQACHGAALAASQMRQFTSMQQTGFTGADHCCMGRRIWHKGAASAVGAAPDEKTAQGAAFCPGGDRGLRTGKRR